MRPGSEQDLSKRGPIPAAHEVPLDEINPVWNRLFSENRMLEYFERLRREDPVHFNETDVAGRYWSLTRYDEIKAVDTDHKNFSSAHGITLGFPIDQPLPKGHWIFLCLLRWIRQSTMCNDARLLRWYRPETWLLWKP